MVVEHPLQGTIYYEFKSVKNLPPNDFVEQFSKDLSRPDFSVDNLRWVFDGRKIKAEDLQKLRAQLERIITYNMAQSYGYADVNTMIEVLFNRVFKIK